MEKPLPHSEIFEYGSLIPDMYEDAEIRVKRILLEEGKTEEVMKLIIKAAPVTFTDGEGPVYLPGRYDEETDRAYEREEHHHIFGGLNVPEYSRLMKFILQKEYKVPYESMYPYFHIMDKYFNYLVWKESGYNMKACIRRGLHFYLLAADILEGKVVVKAV